MTYEIMVILDLDGVCSFLTYWLGINIKVFSIWTLGKNMNIQMFFKQTYKVGHITTYMFWAIPAKYEHELTTTSYQFVRDMHTNVKYSHQYFISNEKLYCKDPSNTRKGAPPNMKGRLI
jgi:hypothetical protein